MAMLGIDIGSPDWTPRGGTRETNSYLSVLRARQKTVFLITGAVVAVALGLSFMQTPVYDSKTTVLVRAPETGTTPERPNMETEKRIADSTIVSEAVIRKLKLKTTPARLLSGLSLNVPVQTEILEFHYVQRVPKEAQRKSQAFAEAYLEYRLGQLLPDILASEATIQDRITQLKDQAASLERAAAHEKDTRARQALEQRANSVRVQIATLGDQLDALSTSYEVAAGVIVDPAALPSHPSKPKPIENGVLGLFIGLVLGVSAALIREMTDDRIRERQDLEAELSAPVLGTIPRIAPFHTSSKGQASMLDDQDSLSTESFRRLRTSVLFAAMQSRDKVLMVTSSRESDGKSETTANLGIALAQSGKMVVLVSADLHRPKLEEIFDLPAGPGLTDVLLGTVTLREALQSTRVGDLQVMRAGSEVGSSADLFELSGIKGVVHTLASQVDFVLIDTAPLLASTDSLLLAAASDAVLFVADANLARRSDLSQAMEKLKSVNARVLGAALLNPSKKTLREQYAAYVRYRSAVG